MRTFVLASLLSYLGVPGNALLLREYGRRALPVLEQELALTMPGEALALDFAGVSVMDTSFVDETLLELALGLIAGRYGDRFLILLAPSPATLDNVEGTIARRRVKVSLPIRDGSEMRLVGHVESNLADAWRLVCAAGRQTARELADTLHLEINTASMRLRKLYDLRLLAREEEVNSHGRQHIYCLPA